MQADPTRTLKLQEQITGQQAKAAEVAKNRAQAGNLESEAMKRRRESHLANLTGVDSPDGFLAWVDEGARSGALSGAEAAGYRLTLERNPAALGMLRGRIFEGSMSPDARATFRAPKPIEQSNGQERWFVDGNPNSATYGQRVGADAVRMLPTPEAMLTDERTRSEGALNRGVTVRGQNMTDARAQQTLEAGRWQNDFESGTQVNMQDGRRRPITDGGAPVGPRPKDMTDSQAKALLFGARAADADRMLSQRAEAGTDRPGTIKSTAETVAGLVPFAGDKLAPVAGTLTNWTQSNAQQSVERAQRDFINAILRRESGAVISQQEFELSLIHI